MKKLILSMLIVGSSLSFSKGLSEYSLPKWVKGVSFTLEPKFDSNLFQINEDILNNELTDPNDGILKTSLGLKTKFLFKPSKKYILINTLKADGVFEYFSNLSDKFLRDEFSVSNSLVGVIPLSKKVQLGHVFYIAANQSQSFEYRDENSETEVKSIENDHMNYSGTFFISSKFNKVLKTSLDLGVGLLDFSNDYSSYSVVSGEQNDSLQRNVKLNNQFKFGKNLVIDTPISYSKAYFRNRSALESNGGFKSSGFAPADIIEKFSFLPKVSLNTPVGNFYSSFGIANQKDLVFGGRSFDGNKLMFGYSLSFLKDHRVFVDYDLSQNNYLTGIDFSDSDGLIREDKITKLSLGYNLTKAFSSPIDLNLKYTYLDSDNGSYGGSFDSNMISSSLTYNL